MSIDSSLIEYDRNVAELISNVETLLGDKHKLVARIKSRMETFRYEIRNELLFFGDGADK